MRQQQQRRVVALAIALASKCTFTGQISIGDVTVYFQGGHVNGGALLAILFPTSASALEKLAHQWNVDLTTTPLIVVAMLVHRVTLLTKSESMKTRSFGALDVVGTKHQQQQQQQQKQQLLSPCLNAG